jgi:hypothetical protein
MCEGRRDGETKMKVSCRGRSIWGCLALGVLGMAAVRSQAGAPKSPACEKVVLQGEVNAGQEWKAAFGQGWVFRVLPIASGKAGYSGWDLMVDREQPAGYPDSLLVATPPYNSINQREVGTTFGLRAQDVIGWNPRSFRFLTSPDAFKESQKLFQVLGGTRHAMETPVVSSREGMAMQRQLKINEKSSAGQFRILEARLTPGVSDAAKYAENWALASPRTPHKFEPAAGGKSTPLGELHWMRFSVTLWLPAGWKAPVELHAVRTACSE